MKSKLILSLFMGASLISSANGYKDGIEYFKADQFNNAKDILLRNINNADTDKALSYYYLGAIDLRDGKKAEAKANFDKGVSANPACSYNYVGLGQLALLNNEVKVAEEYFKKALSFNKKDAAVCVLIARAYYNADPAKYTKEITKNLDNARKYSKNTEPSIYIFEGDMLMDQKQVGDAAARYENAIYYEDSNSEGYVKYANAYFQVNPEYAIQKLEELNAKQPTSALAQRELAEKYYENSQWRKASDTYGKYIKNPNHFPEDRSRYSVLLYYNKSYQPSLEIAESYLANDANNFLMNRMKMLNLAALGKNEEAKVAAEKFFSLKGYFTGNDYVTYADVLTAVGEPESGVAIIERGARDLSDNPAMQQKLSETYLNAKRYGDAAAAFDKYLNTKATKEELTVADYFAAGGRYLTYAASTDSVPESAAAATKGITYINKALEQQPNNPSLIRRKAQLIMVGNGKEMNLDAANEYLRLIKLLDLNPDGKNPANSNNDIAYYKNAYQMLGLYYDGIKDKANAVKYFSLMLELDPENEAVRNYIENAKASK